MARKKKVGGPIQRRAPNQTLEEMITVDYTIARDSPAMKVMSSMLGKSVEVILSDLESNGSLILTNKPK